MTWVAVAVAGAAVVGGVMSSKASKKAASSQQASAAEATAEQRRQYDVTRADQAPFMQTGVMANARLRALLGMDPNVSGASVLDTDPIYKSSLQFGLDEGRNAINSRAIAGGGYDSGATLKALTRYGTDYGMTKGNEVYNRLAGVSGAGQQATNAVGAYGANMANNVSDLITGAGNARAAGVVGGANAWNSALGGVSGAAMNYQNNQTLQELLRRRNQGTYDNPNYRDSGSYGDF